MSTERSCLTIEEKAELWRDRLGTARLEPSGPIVAGTIGTWTIRYTVGSHGIDDGGTIKIGQRGSSDWEDAQFHDPTGSGFTTVTTGGPATLTPRFSFKGHIRPWFWAIVIDVTGAALAPGETVEVVLGDTRYGSPGIRAQTFRETEHRFGVFVDPTNSNTVEEISDRLLVEILTAPPATLWSTVPTETIVGREVQVIAHFHDRWGNHCGTADNCFARWIGDAPVESSRGMTFTFAGEGSGYFDVAATVDGKTITTTTNPLRIRASKPRLRKLWGDLHAQTGETVGSGSEYEYFEFARDAARLDFASHQANDFQVGNQYWEAINTATSVFHEPGRFVTFPGYEWSGNTSVGGDRNVFFLDEGHPIFRANDWLLDPSERGRVPLARSVPELFERIRENVPLEKVLLGAHCGGRYANIPHSFDPELGPLVEVISCWGIFEWLVRDALGAGHRIAIMGNSDGHHGRPGLEKPGIGEFGIPGGLTCVFAEEFTRESIFAALKERRCYATTGARIDLTVKLLEHPMGSLVELDRLSHLSVDVHGTAPIDSVALIEGVRTISVARPPEFENSESSTVRISWKGARARGRGARLVWDGTISTEGARIESASGFGFDAPVNGFSVLSDHEIEIASYTSGDTDGVALRIDGAESGSRVGFASKQGEFWCTLGDLPPVGDHVTHTVQGLDAEVRFERYPDRIETRKLAIKFPVEPRAEETAYWVKVVQTDGHCAWSSPVYVSRK